MHNIIPLSPFSPIPGGPGSPRGPAVPSLPLCPGGPSMPSSPRKTMVMVHQFHNTTVNQDNKLPPKHGWVEYAIFFNI